ncbi:hypothetical protein JF729_07195 [Mycobacterium intracellulare]|uniref:hypothetical protein n=1 Tax=Mycobacterium intracellulare TaxID=1767 RepID=UPI001CD9CDE1|nr:hypothetical protein [Mycobacterium intracellulare]MCA2247582.1 hypothetical protein [Mycobacterium intracellulare]
MAFPQIVPPRNRLACRRDDGGGVSATAYTSTRAPVITDVTHTVERSGQAGVLAAQILAALQGRIYGGLRETQIQDRVGAALAAAGLVFERECRLSERDRPDFLVGGQVVVEVKLKTPRSVVLRQLGRYAEHGQVEAIVLATTSFSTLRNMRVTIHQVPVYPAVLRGVGLLA